MGADDSPVEPPAQVGFTAATTGEPSALAPSERTIGPYRLLRRLGDGGMGEVWLAEQTHPRRQVALKLIRAALDTAAHFVARFEAERQALAVMDHPAIAKVFDGGATPECGPYFVMEYVRGDPITAYCDRQQLSTRERLDLFLQVCDGVQHAHQKGIIHRDLKPSNILVTLLDGRPVTKIIDFGVAKAVAQPLTDRTMYTALVMLIGTPEYMSPEQAEMTGQDIDTRTDVYALGVILYELLTGVLPFDARRLRAQGFDAMRRTIREVEPPRPSARVTPTKATDAPEKLRAGGVALGRELRGDLDWITLRALEKDRTRRYGSAAELAADVRRHLEHLPVLASPPSVPYRMGKFVARHRLGVAVAAMLLGLLVAFAATTALQARRIAQERDRANQEAAVARAINDFLTRDLLAQAGAGAQASTSARVDPDLTVRTALDRAAQRIAGKFEGQPLVEASIRETIGGTYQELGLYANSQSQLERALELRRQALGAEHLDTLRSARRLGELYALQANFDEAESLLTSVVATARRRLGDRDPETLTAMNILAALYQRRGRYAEAEPLYAEALERLKAVLGDEHPVTLETMGNLASLYRAQNKYSQAEPLYMSANAIRRRVLGDDHPETLLGMSTLAALYVVQGRFAEAEALMTSTLEGRRRVLGEDHPSTLVTMNNLGVMYLAQRRYADAESLFSRVLDTQRRVLGDAHPDTLTSMLNIGLIHLRRDEYLQADGLLTRVLDERRRVLGPQHVNTLIALVTLGSLRIEQGRYQEADSLLREAVAAAETADANGWRRYQSQSVLGASLLRQGKYAEAEPLLIGGYRGMIERQASIPAQNRDALEEGRQWIVQLYRAWGKPEQLAEWR